MRRLYIILFCIVSLSSGATEISNAVTSAFDKMMKGEVMQSLEQLKNAASSNDVLAQFYLAQCYEYGIGIDKNAVEAFRVYRRAAERGFAPAMNELSRCYRNGIGVTPNSARADEWLSHYKRRSKGVNYPSLFDAYSSGLAYASARQSSPDVVAEPITVSKPIAEQPVNENKTQQLVNSVPVISENVQQQPNLSDVDIDIPLTNVTSPNTFALIIANENYQEVSTVSNALNDGEIFSRYCTQTLGLPETNVHLIKDATLNNIKRGVNRFRQIAEAYEGQASFIIYYAGHGIPDEKTRDSYLMPVDGFNTDVTTCYSLNDFYATIGGMPSKKTLVLLDACFSGTNRGDGMLAYARGVAIKSKQGVPIGNTIVISSATGDETAYPYQEQNHGLFTYFVLKKIKESRGDISLGELADYVISNVSKKAIVVNGKSQTPTVNPSQNIINEWKNWNIN